MIGRQPASQTDRPSDGHSLVTRAYCNGTSPPPGTLCGYKNRDLVALIDDGQLPEVRNYVMCYVRRAARLRQRVM